MGELNKRGSTRKRVLKGGMIIFNDRRSTLSCTVRDLSETGARLRVAKGAAVPDRFDLSIDTDGLDAPCTVAWRKGEEIGVRFDSVPTKGSPKRAQVVTGLERQSPLLRRRPRG